jgi:hypothetical protein
MNVGSAGSYFQALNPLSGAAPGVNPAKGKAANDFAAALTDVAGPAGSPSISDEDRYAPQPDQDLSYLTPDDRRMIKASTGYVVSSDGKITNPTPGKAVDSFISILASERRQGNVTGATVTPSYLQGLFAKYGNDSQNANAAFNPDYLGKALKYLADSEKQKAADGLPRQSLNVAL